MEKTNQLGVAVRFLNEVSSDLVKKGRRFTEYEIRRMLYKRKYSIYTGTSGIRL